MTDEIITDIVIIDPVAAIERAKQHSDIVRIMRKDKVLRQGTDYGIIPGTKKPTLLKPGAEKLCSAFGLRPEFSAITVIEDFDKPLFFYRYECKLYHIETEKLIATAIGSCNSMESKYGFRWVNQHEIPPHIIIDMLPTKSTNISEFDFAINKAETTGKYGKPESYWDMWRQAIKSGQANRITRKTARGDSDAWEIASELYRIPNEDIYSQVNTVDKMAQKRSLIAVTLIATNASEDFTQDVEDMPGFGTADVVDAEFEDVEPTKQPEQNPTTGQRKAPEPKSKTSWTKEQVDGIFGYWTEQGLMDKDILRFAGFAEITEKYDFKQWSKYPTKQDASAAIQKAFQAELAQEQQDKSPSNGNTPAVYACKFTHMTYEVAGQKCLKFANCNPTEWNSDMPPLVMVKAFARSTEFKTLVGEFVYELLDLKQYDGITKTQPFIPMPEVIEFEYVEKAIQKGKYKGETYKEIIGVAGNDDEGF